MTGVAMAATTATTRNIFLSIVRSGSSVPGARTDHEGMGPGGNPSRSPLDSASLPFKREECESTLVGIEGRVEEQKHTAQNSALVDAEKKRRSLISYRPTAFAETRGSRRGGAGRATVRSPPSRGCRSGRPS